MTQLKDLANFKINGKPVTPPELKSAIAVTFTRKRVSVTEAKENEAADANTWHIQPIKLTEVSLVAESANPNK